MGHPGRLAAGALALGLATGCQRIDVAAEGRPCVDGQCAEGYACDPRSDLCAPAIVVDCDDPEALCPSRVNTSDGCLLIGAFIPCVDGVTDCDMGCRTCQADGLWTECDVQPPDPCVLGRPQSCANCSDNCTQTVLNATVSCLPLGSTFSCDYSVCALGAVDLDVDRTNGCECVTSAGGVEVCDGVDNDCDGVDDDGAVCVNGLCEGGACVPCTPSDRNRCGPQCDVCTGETPDCVMGMCVCNSGSCLTDRACRAGVCEDIVCGDGWIGGMEDCDPVQYGGADCTTFGFYDGTLACDMCAFDTMGCHHCGNGTIQAGEQCDGSMFAVACQNFGCNQGTPACNSCTSDPATCRECTPTVPGLQVWLDAADSSTMTIAMGRVSAWADKSGNNRHAQQASATLRPIVQPAVVNGRDVIRFEGAQRLELGDLSSAFPTAATVFVVAFLYGDLAYNLLDTGGEDTWWRWHGDDYSYPAVFRSPRVNAFVLNPPTYGTHVFTFESSAGVYRYAVDGAVRGNGAPAYFAGSDFRLGSASSSHNNGDKYLIGDIAEVMLYDRVLSAAEYQEVLSYLFDKWKDCSADAHCGTGQTCRRGSCGPIVHWSFDTAQAPQPSGFGGPATNLMGGVAHTMAGRAGGALRFDGMDDWTLAQSAVAFAQTNYTISFWFKTAGTTHATLFAAPYDMSGGLYGIVVEINPLGQPAGSLRFLHRPAGAPVVDESIYGGSGYNDDGWHHVAAVKDGATKFLYVDGALLPTLTVNEDLGGGLDIALGVLGPDFLTRWASGSIDEVRIYPEALSAAEVDALYMNP